MHVRIEAECRRGLKIIGEIPDITLCKLEGYNGIGKTSAIRLLQLCTGSQPFNDLSWRTFCTELIGAKIRVTNLIGAHEVEWILRPDQWQTAERRNAIAPSDQMIGITIDGRRALINDVRSILAVHHLNVTETPARILAVRAQAGRQALHSWHSTDERAHTIDALMFTLVKLLGSLSTDEIRLAVRIAGRSQSESEEAKAQSTKAQNRVKLLQAAVATADRLEALQGASPGHLDRLSEMEQELANIDSRKEELDEKIASAHANQASDKRAEDKYVRAQKALERASQAQRKAVEELKNAATSAGVSTVRERVDKEIVTIDNKLKQLLDAQPHINAGPMLASLLQELLPPLDTAISSELGEHVLVEANGEVTEWTVTGLRDALHQQLMKLSETDPGTDALQLERDISIARTRLGALNSILQKIDAVAEAESKLRKAEDNLVNSASALPGKTASHLDALIHERKDCERRGRELQSDIDVLKSELTLIGGGQTEEQLMSELSRLCIQAEVDQSRLRGTLKNAQDRSALLIKQEAQATVAFASSSREANSLLGKLQQIVLELTTADAYEWLRRAVPGLASLATLPLEEQLSAIERLAVRLEHARDVLESTTRTVEAISADLGEVAQRLNESSLSSLNELPNIGPAAAWLAEEARQWFDDEVMRKAMFDGGHNVCLDPRDLSLSWTVNGDVYQRPLVGFSSGEQAFTYTRAQLSQLERDAATVANRLIALDEFGAFLDGQRISDLTNDLVARQARVPQDQVVVILPSDMNLSQAEDTASTSRSASLARHGYYAGPLQT